MRWCSCVLFGVVCCVAPVEARPQFRCKALRAGLLSSDAGIRRRVAREKPSVMDASRCVVGWLSSPKRARRLAASYWLSLHGARRQERLAVLRKRLSREPHWGVRLYLVRALGRSTGKKATIRATVRSLGRVVRRDRMIAVRMEGLQALFSIWKRVRGRTNRQAVWRRLQPVFRDRLRRGDWRERRALMRLVAQFGPVAMPLIRVGLRDASSRVRAESAMSAGHWKAGAKPLLSVFRKMLGASSWRIRYAAAEACKRMGASSRGIASALIRALSDRNWGVRYSSSHALAQMGGRVLPALKRAWKGASSRTALALVDTIQRMSFRSKRAFWLLRRGLLHRDMTVRYAATRALLRWKRLPSSMVPALLRCVRDRDWRVQEGAIQALARVSRAKRVRQSLWKVMRRSSHSAVRLAALRTLSSHEFRPQAGEWLRCHRDPHLQVFLLCVRTCLRKVSTTRGVQKPVVRLARKYEARLWKESKGSSFVSLQVRGLLGQWREAFPFLKGAKSK